MSKFLTKVKGTRLKGIFLLSFPFFFFFFTKTTTRREQRVSQSRESQPSNHSLFADTLLVVHGECKLSPTWVEKMVALCARPRFSHFVTAAKFFTTRFVRKKKRKKTTEKHITFDACLNVIRCENNLAMNRYAWNYFSTIYPRVRPSFRSRGI